MIPINGNLLVVRAKKAVARGGIHLPDQAQAADAIVQIIAGSTNNVEEGDVVVVNEAMLTKITVRGDDVCDAISGEAVVAKLTPSQVSKLELEFPKVPDWWE